MEAKMMKALLGKLVAIAMSAALVLMGAPAFPQSAQARECGALVVAAPARVAASDDYDVSWFEGHESPFTVVNVKQLKGLAHLVNSGEHDFKGEIVQLPDSSISALVFSGSMSIDPIGTEAHPFEGTFDGHGRPIVNLAVNSTGRLSYLGLFGSAGDSSKIKDLSLQGGSVEVLNSADGKAISHVGAIAGHLGGSIENCTSSAIVSVTNDGAVPAITGKTPEQLCTITYVGGLVGSLGGDMRDCTHTGELSIASKSNVTEGVPYIAGFVGGIAGIQGLESDASHVTMASGCKNAGRLSFNVNGKGGIDRFQQQMYSKSVMVGGIVGYAMGNVASCENNAEIQTSFSRSGKTALNWGATTTGGIVGSLRGPAITDETSATGVVGTSVGDPGYDVWKKSGGKEKPPVLTVEKCVNTGHVVGLSSVGGICGSAGAFTEIAGCANEGKIDGTRWNKPCPAGIVGISSGDIAYCSNNGRVETLDGGGFYASGICAILSSYNEASTPAEVVMEGPEIYGCYVSQPMVSAQAGYKTAVLASENDGFIHDNCFLPNLTLDKVVDKDVFGDDQPHSALVVEGENRGTVSDNHELSLDELCGSKGISLLNRISAMSHEWKKYYYVANAAANGFPLLNWRPGAYAGDTADLGSLVSEAKVEVNPRYSSVVTPVPSVVLETRDGRILYQNADYRVVPQEGATEVTSGRPYSATIEGMGRYAGSCGHVAYGIDKCPIDECTVLAGSQAFNWNAQKPAWVKVVDEAGNEVPESDYELVDGGRVDCDPGNVKADKDGKFHDYTNVHADSYKYDIKVTAKPSSKNYQGETTQAAFHIERALLVYESPDAQSVKRGCSYDKVVWGGQEWDYGEAVKTKGLVKIQYTAKPIEPTIANPAYLGVPLRNGSGKEYWANPLAYDFRYIYGNANAENAQASGADCVNVTGSDEKSLACMTVRYTPGGNFTNYANVFFEIIPASIDGLEVSGLGKAFPYTGSRVTPVPKLKYNGVELPASDFTFSYRDNVKIGTATMTIAGKNFSGVKTVQFKIGKGVQPLRVKATRKVVKRKVVARKSATVSPLNVIGAVGKATYKNTSKKAILKKFKVTSSGRVVVPKGTKKGAYKVSVTVLAKGNRMYAPCSKTVCVVILVK